MTGLSCPSLYTIKTEDWCGVQGVWNSKHTSLLLLLLLFLTFSALVANPKKLLYTVANPARGLLNREKKKKKKSGSAPPPPPPARAARSEKKKKKKKKSRGASTCLGATQAGVTQVVSVRLASIQGFLRLVS